MGVAILWNFALNANKHYMFPQEIQLDYSNSISINTKGDHILFTTWNIQSVIEYISQWPNVVIILLLWRHNGCDGVSNHQPHDYLLNDLFRSKKTPKLRVTGLGAGNSPVTGEFPAQRASNAENVSKISIWWRHHVHTKYMYMYVVH